MLMFYGVKIMLGEVILGAVPRLWRERTKGWLQLKKIR